MLPSRYGILIMASLDIISQRKYKQMKLKPRQTGAPCEDEKFGKHKL